MAFPLSPQWFKERCEIKRAVGTLVKQLEPLATNNEWARMVLNQLTLSGNIPAFNYNQAKFINEGYVGNPNVFSVINKIIEPAKQIPWQVFKVTNRTEFKKYKSFKKQGMHIEAALSAHKAFEIVENTDLNKFVEKPNQLQTMAEFVEMAVGYYLLTGNDFHYKFTPTGWKYPTQMYILPAQVTEIIPGDWQRPAKGYKLAFGASNMSIDADKVVHRKKFNPTFNWTINPSDYLYGLSPLAPLCRTIQRSNQSIDASLAMLLNGFPPGILSYEGNTQGNPMQPSDTKKVQDAWRERQGGGHNANMPVIAPVPLSWQAMGLKSADMELLDADKASLEQIAGVYSVPLPIVLMDAATLDNAKVAEKQLYEKAIIPNLSALRDSLNSEDSIVGAFNRATGGEYYIDYDLSSIAVLQEDMKDKVEIITKLMDRGIYTGNDVLYAMGQDTQPDNELLNQRILSTGLKYSDVENIPAEYKVFISVINSLSPLVANNVIGAMTENELRALVGIGPLKDGDETINQMINNRAQPQVTTNTNGE